MVSPQGANNAAFAVLERFYNPQEIKAGLPAYGAC